MKQVVGCRCIRVVFAILFIAFQHRLALATGLESLESFMRTVRAGRAAFTQVVTPPPRDGQAVRSKTSSGRFEFQRPGRLRLTYARPFEQVMVADGQTLWLYDVDLNQVTARRQAQALGATPAALLGAAADLRALEAEFVLEDAPERDGLQWVTATPRVKDGPLNRVLLGWRVGERGPVPAVLEMLDSFGQRSVLRFADFEVNPVLTPDRFQFRPPPGADVVRP